MYKANYPDSPSYASVTKPLELVRGIRVIDGGSDSQYSPAAPPIITLSELPQGPEAILPEFSPNVSAAGTITSVDVIIIGQYLQPSKKHLQVQRFVTPDEFKEFKEIGLKMGFRHVESSALVRSSYRAQKLIN